MSDQKSDSRGLLLYRDIDAFGAWASTVGYRREPTPPAAEHEVLRLRPTAGGPPVIFHRRSGRRESSYVTTTKLGTELFFRWQRERAQ
ncbi:hypothetical protein [Sorangium sp. So ce388]|uniref:hypothetical protein n=1 Tax=Sorangium sp. So ce388 TaxID=3133309 RepID=UPI003F5AF0C9